MHRRTDKKLWLLQLLLLFEGSLSSKVTTWKQVYINESSYEESSVKSSVSTSSDITCSILATKSSNLFCYDKGVCRLSDVIVPNNKSRAEGQDLDCRTKVKNCPELSKRIGTKCYNIIGNIVKRNLFDAQQHCTDQGGFLPEPDVTFEALEILGNGLVLEFPTEMKTVIDANKSLWVGLYEDGNNGDFKYLKSGETVSTRNLNIYNRNSNEREALSLTVTDPYTNIN